MYLLIFFILFMLLLICGHYHRLRGAAWLELVADYYDPKSKRISWGLANDTFYIWLNNKNEKTVWVNGVIVEIDSVGLRVKQMALNSFLKPLFFKWDEIAIEGNRRHWLFKRIVISNKKNDVLFSLSRKFEDEIRERIGRAEVEKLEGQPQETG